MDMQQEYTSTGFKLMHHPDLLAKIKEKKQLFPVSVQVAPTALCNLNCGFCSNRNRQKDESLEFARMMRMLVEFRMLRAKTVEFTGGGEPTLYGQINDAVVGCAEMGYEIGLITNGTGFNRLSPDALRRLKWIRVSMNCLDYLDDIEIPDLSPGTTLGFSYVWNEVSTLATLERIREYGKKYRPAYVRVVPDCQADTAWDHQKMALAVANWGDGFFWQAKEPVSCSRCWWGYVKPFLLHDGWVYPCSSVVLNSDSGERFHEKYRWMKIADLHLTYWSKHASGQAFTPIPIPACDHCVFSGQNTMLEDLMHPSGMESFV